MRANKEARDPAYLNLRLNFGHEVGKTYTAIHRQQNYKLIKEFHFVLQRGLKRSYEPQDH